MEVSPKLVEDNGGDIATEFDWTDYNYDDNLYVPRHLDDNSDNDADDDDDDDEYDAWNTIVNRRRQELLQQEQHQQQPHHHQQNQQQQHQQHQQQHLEEIVESASVKSDDASSNASSNTSKKRPGTPTFKRWRTPPRVHFKQSMEEIFYKHRDYNNMKTKKGGILKHDNNNNVGLKNDEALTLPAAEKSKTFSLEDENTKATNTDNIRVTNTIKIGTDRFEQYDMDDDITESIRQFDKYISEKVVRFAKQNKDSKIRYLWSNSDVGNKAQWERGKRRNNRRTEEKSVHFSNSTLQKDNVCANNETKGEFHLPLIKYSPNYKTIRGFEKRNVTRTISKLGNLESLFIKNKPSSPDMVSNSDDGEGDISSDEGESRNVPRTDRRGSLRGDSSDALMSSHRGIRLKRAIRKVQKLLATEKGNKLRKSIRTMAKEKAGVEQTHSKTSPLERFCHAGRLIILLLRAVGIKPEKPEDSDYNFLSWTILYDELGLSRTPYDPSGLTFDPQKFKASKESFLSKDVEDILLKKPRERTDDQVQQVIRFLSQVVPAFGEYPMRIQRSTLKCCTLERFEGGRVIIRQGHKAENFYFIISGTAIVTVMESGANHVHTVNSLTTGNSFGELAFLNMSQRTATVTCRDTMELLCIEREDFIEIFMRRIKGQEPEHMTFLRNVELLKGWPIEKLPLDNLRICAFTYVRRGITLSADSSKSDWLFVVVSGTCKILKAIIDLDVGKDRQTNHRQCIQIPLHTKKHKPIINVEQADSHIVKGHVDERNRGRRSKFNVLQPPQRQPSAIDIIVNRSSEEVQLSKEEHLNQLEFLYQKRHVLPSINNKNDKNGNRSISSPDENGNNVNHHQNHQKNSNYNTRKSHASKNVLFTPPLHIKPTTPTQFLRETTQNFGIHRSARSAARRIVLASPGASTVHAWNTGPQVKKVFLEVARLEPGDVFGLEQLVMSGREDVTATSLVSDGAEVIILDKKFFRKHLTEETAKRIRKLIRPMPSESVLQQNFIDQKYWDAYKTKTLEGFKGKIRHHSVHL